MCWLRLNGTGWQHKLTVNSQRLSVTGHEMNQFQGWESTQSQLTLWRNFPPTLLCVARPVGMQHSFVSDIKKKTTAAIKWNIILWGMHVIKGKEKKNLLQK